MPFEKGKYDMAYARDHIKRKHIPFNDTNPDDVVLLDWLGKQTNVTAYIKALISDDMNRIRCQNGCQIKTEDAGDVDE